MFKSTLTIVSGMLLAALLGIFQGGPACAAEMGLKQPIFLLCPHTKGADAWSLFFVVNANDHSKIMSLGLEKLIKQNSKDSSYGEVVAAQAENFFAPGAIL